MKFDRPLAVIDLESTGLDPVSDRIVQIGIVRYCPDTFEEDMEKLQWLVNPGRAIPPEVIAIHGITDEMVKDAPSFKAIAKEVEAMLSFADLCGYNLRRLDLPLLDEEFRRCGSKLILEGVRIIDCYGIFAKKCPRTLADAVRTFCGRDHSDESHDAMADALATLDVLQGQLATYPDLKAMTVAELAKFSAFGDHDYADLAGKLYRDADGDLRYSFGKSKDVKVRDDLGYAKWMLNKASFPGNTNDVLTAELDRLDAEARGNTLYPDGPGEPF